MWVTTRLTTYYTIDRAVGSTNFRTWSATRDTIDGEWNTPEMLDVASGFSTRTARISEDGLTLYFAASRGRMSHSNLPQLYKAERASPEDPFEQHEPLRLHGGNPTVSSDELAIFYNRGSNPLTEKSLIAIRESKDDPFGEPVELNDFGSGSQLQGSVGWQVISPDWPADGSKLHYSGTSNPMNPGSYEVYEATWNVDLIGDYSADGSFDVDDLDRLSSAIHSGSNHRQFDLDQSGTVDLADRQFWITDLKSTWIGDANLDGQFNSTDFIEVFQAAKYESGESASWSEGDWNGDQRFDSSDFTVAFQDGGYEMGARAAVAAVPEPSSLALFVGALIGLCRITRRRKK